MNSKIKAVDFILHMYVIHTFHGEVAEKVREMESLRNGEDIWVIIYCVSVVILYFERNNYCINVIRNISCTALCIIVSVSPSITELI